MPPLNPIDTAKYAAAVRAADLVQDGMTVGLGTGSTAAWMVRRLGERVRDDGLRVTGVPTSARTADLAREVGVPLTTLDEVRWLDLTIDGADEVDPRFALIKGGGGALLWEKIVATASDRMVVITDATKRVAHLGAFPLPVEVIPFGWRTSQALIEELLGSLDVTGDRVVLRTAGDAPYRTDQGNLILDLHLLRIANPRHLALMLNQVPGVVENGLFVDICDTLVTGHADGRVEVQDVHEGTRAEARIDLGAPANIFADVGRGAGDGPE